MRLRPGNAGSNTAADHISVLAQAIAQIPARFRRHLIVRCDGAGASHELIEHITALNSSRRRVHFVVGWKVTEPDEAAIGKLSPASWRPAVEQDGLMQDDADVAEITGLNERLGMWPDGTRLIVRRSKPSRRHERKLADFERATGWRYQITATSIDVLPTVSGSHHDWFLDALYRHRGAAEDQVKVFAHDVESACQNLNSFGRDATALQWVGQTAEAFKGQFGPLPGRLQKLYISYSEASDALAAYAPRLQTAQRAKPTRHCGRRRTPRPTSNVPRPTPTAPRPI